MKVGTRLLLFTIVAVLAALVRTPDIAFAEFPSSDPNTVSVHAGAAGPVATEGTAGFGNAGIEASANSASVHDAGSAQGGYYSYGGYTYKPVASNTVFGPVQTVQYDATGALIKPAIAPSPACGPGETGYFVYGPDGSAMGVICVPASTPSTPAPGTPVTTLVQQASSLIPWPNLVVNANPDSGLSGLSSWFWLGGGSAVVPPASATAGPLTVTVRATLVDAIWDFGEGTAPLDSGSSLGKAYPTPSDVSHLYQASSYGLASGFTLTVTLRFSVAYSVNGGSPTPFGTAARTYSRSYPVYQAQPEGVSQ